ncbi:tetratricopeptide repeat protein [Amedibacterium intestinale]|uniref:Uncharacterized protein n=1 Tax=Amedibacterium intestinale TaxID=2583452 RepID=A0A6N4THQ2_9FIRM|nr:hypothetical protein [Amedibacterium intestinale]RHO29395.1 hypothetical protein DW208_07510 [Erysipelotrichaceae bacterium AM17-60]BBK21955.1 hypothetical protein Aargi30884_08580 [Amedibacterium intestinale]
MFAEEIKLIEDKKYDEAVVKLQSFLSSDNEKIRAEVNYFLGYIHTRWDYKAKKSKLAMRYLYNNLNSSYPHPFAYVLYADVAEDANVAINYLNRGRQLFPKDPMIYMKLFQLSLDKNAVIETIQESGLNDSILLGKVISYLLSSNQWDKVHRFIFRIFNGNVLSAEDNSYLRLIEAYANLFKNTPNYQKAQMIFEELISWDIDNRFAYSHFLGLIFSYINLENYKKATELFDRIPISNIIHDFDDMLYPLGININFESIYCTIFKKITNFFNKDLLRKNKAKVLYSMYLYYPSEIYDIYRYKKSDALILSKYLKLNFNKKVATVLFNMRCHFGQFKEAYEILWDFLKNYENPNDSDIYISQIFDHVLEDDLLCIASYTIDCFQKEEFNEKMFVESIFSEMIIRMHSLNLFEHIRNISQFILISDILDSECAFECAFAYGKDNHFRSIEIYEGIIKREPNNTSCINNLGVQYEHRGNLYDALDCYEKANTLHPSEPIYNNNLKRINKLIQDELELDVSHIIDIVSIDSLEEIGYTIGFCKKIYSINDKIMRDILLRDLKECAFAIVAQQDKLASIMCGSIIEALLMYKIVENNISKYDISEISKKKNAVNYNVNDMGLNELLFVAHKEKLINTNSYHLAHYVKDYRNIVHPAKEKRIKEKINHENVLMMWSVLKRILNELLA